MLWYLLLCRCWSKLTLCCMALIAVCLSVTFVICGRANEGSGGPESKVRERGRGRGRDGLAGEGGREWREWGREAGVCVCPSLVCQLQICWCGSRSFPSVTLLIYLIYLNHLLLPPINTGDLNLCVCVCTRACTSTTTHLYVCVCVCMCVCVCVCDGIKTQQLPFLFPEDKSVAEKLIFLQIVCQPS